MAHRSRQASGKDRQQRTPEEIEAMNKMFLLTNDPLALAAASRNTILSPPEDRIRSINVPVLALIGEADPLKVNVDTLDGLMRNLKIAVIDMGIISQEALVTKFIKDEVLKKERGLWEVRLL